MSKFNELFIYFFFDKELINSEEWRDLPGSSKAFYFHLKSLYDGTNNNHIKFPYSAMEGVIGCSTKGSFTMAMRHLIAKGWIKKRTDLSNRRRPNLFELTFKYDHAK